MFVGAVALRYQHHTTHVRCVVLIMECYNSHKHSQSSLTNSNELGRVMYLKLPIHLENIEAIFFTAQKKTFSYEQNAS